MTDVLAPRHAAEVTAFVRGGALLAFDFDGTLAPIVVDHREARLRPATRRLFGAICGRATCAVLSGRSLPDLALRLEGIPVPHLVGNHGATLAGADAERRLVARAVTELRTALSRIDGVDVEEAGLSVAVHYRRASRPVAARRLVESAAARASAGMRVVPGKMVVNLVPAALPHKGDALRALLRRSGQVSALYVGDDQTDEDVFTLAGDVDLLAVRVGRTPRSAAGWYFRRQRDIDDLLRLLIAARAGRRRRGAAPDARAKTVASN